MAVTDQHWANGGFHESPTVELPEKGQSLGTEAAGIPREVTNFAKKWRAKVTCRELCKGRKCQLGTSAKKGNMHLAEQE
jgi:hypothetical protein